MPGMNIFYHDKPIFGLDIGLSSIKAMQMDDSGKKLKVKGYGAKRFDTTAATEGVITKPQVLATAIQELLTTGLVGKIDARRVCLTVPAARTFIRSMTIPAIAAKDLAEAVQLEVEQYIPAPINELYLDYNVIRRTEKETELLVVAAPQKVIDSYLALAKLLDLEVVAMEPTIVAASRLFAKLEHANASTILIDFGSISSDIIVYDETLITADTVMGGGDNFTGLIAKQLNIQPHEAYFIKTTYGLSKSLKQKDIMQALAPVLEQLVKEIKRIIRYYEERSSSDKKITQIVTLGGGANMPGLNEYLTDTLRLPTRTFASWLKIDFQDLQPPTDAEQPMYTTVAGLAMLDAKELFA